MPGDAPDLGCGGGQASIALAARGYRVVGVDFAPSAIALARRNAPELEFIVGGEAELDAELTGTGFAIVRREARPDLQLRIGHHLVRVARRSLSAIAATRPM